MRNRMIEGTLLILIFLLILVIAVLGLQRQDRQILGDAGKTPEFTAADQAYLQSHRKVRVAVEADLAYLIGDSGGGYLPDYLTAVLEPAGLKPIFTEEADGTEDCRLRIVTRQLRSQKEGFRYTAPLFQVEGRLFLRSGKRPGDSLQVLVRKDRLTEKKLSGLTCRGAGLTWSEEDTARDLVAAAVRTRADGILGDSGAVEAALDDADPAGRYSAAEKTLYRLNACILTASGDVRLNHILNQCIQVSDRHNLSYEMREKWLGGKGPIYMDQARQTSYLPVLIIILSALIAFFLYYMANRGMYRELDVRLDQITESRNEMQTTFHGVGHYMAELSTGGEITDVNRAFAKDITASALHRRLWDVLDMDEEGRQKIRSMIEHGARGIQDPRLEAKIGSRIFVMDIFPVEDARGDVGQLLYMAIDVTQERMTKRQMLQNNKMIAIGQLAAGVAHEIRNPLGIIRNYCYVLKTMEDEEIRARAIAEIEKAVETSGGIINHLLDFSRISPGRKEEIDVEDHVRSLLSLNETSFRSHHIELRIQCERPIRTYIAMEPFDMILLNLVKNAMDAVAAADQENGDSIDETGRVTIHLEMDEERDDMFILSVADTGVGIDEEALEEIYNPFYTTKGSQGTGLGLYIVYNEIEKLDGQIEVSSRRGEGTVFRVRLPIRRRDDKEEGNG